MARFVTLAVDCMGGDHGPSVTVPAVMRFLEGNPDARCILVGLKEPLESALAQLSSPAVARATLRFASEVVAMDEAPAHAIKRKKDSSMRVAIDLVKAGAADAIVSAGNTGALMGMAHFVLRTLPGIDRPALVALMPTVAGHCYLLDLGASPDCSAENLRQFAVMGSTLVACVENRARPSVGLLNIGSEAIKGNAVVKQAAELLHESALNFVGNVEGDGIFWSETDVIVSDGFVGNVVLKSVEGLARMFRHNLTAEFRRGPIALLGALFAWPVLSKFRKRFDHRQYNGAMLIGLQGMVVKSHGSADAVSFGSALGRAATLVRTDVLARISAGLAPREEQLAQ
jgi:glycerol-3-phosphate acyltransferase PlsX